jgi:hypothetical protein
MGVLNCVIIKIAALATANQNAFSRAVALFPLARVIRNVQHAIPARSAITNNTKYFSAGHKERLVKNSQFLYEK